MSSNIRVQKICQFCGKEFEARKITSKTCSDICAKKLYKLNQRTNKINDIKIETKQKIIKPIEELKAKEFLSVTEASKLIGCSRQNIHLLIKSGKLKAKNILKKKIIIKRVDIDNLLS